MGKTFKYSNDENTSSKNNAWQKEAAIKKQKSPRGPSQKQISGHFSKMHVWPVSDTKSKSKKGPKI